MNILGLDLSLNGPGFCTAPDRVSSMTMTTKDGDRRLVRLRDAIDHYLARIPSPSITAGYDLAVIESVPGSSYATQALDHVHGVAREVLARYGVPFVYVAAPTLKAYATGDSRAEKQAMHDALPESIRYRVRNDNEADAWWLADMGRTVSLGRSAWRLLDPWQINALSKVAWPTGFGGLEVATTVRSKPAPERCGHGYYCLRNAGRLLHPMLLDVCDKPAKPKSRAKGA